MVFLTLLCLSSVAPQANPRPLVSTQLSPSIKCAYLLPFVALLGKHVARSPAANGNHGGPSSAQEGTVGTRADGGCNHWAQMGKRFLAANGLSRRRDKDDEIKKEAEGSEKMKRDVRSLTLLKSTNRDACTRTHKHVSTFTQARQPGAVCLGRQ